MMALDNDPRIPDLCVAIHPWSRGGGGRRRWQNIFNYFAPFLSILSEFQSANNSFQNDERGILVYKMWLVVYTVKRVRFKGTVSRS